MILVGCDLHSRKQQVAVLDTNTGEVLEEELAHHGDAVERFYRALPSPVTIGIETTGYTQWFHAFMHRLGHTVLVGEAAKIRAMVVRKTKTDRRDARHLLDLLKHERFPSVWLPDPDTRDLRALVAHRVRLVRMQITSCAAVRGRMDSWWTFARGNTTLHAFLSTRRDKSNDAVTP